MVILRLGLEHSLVSDRVLISSSQSIDHSIDQSIHIYTSPTGRNLRKWPRIYERIWIKGLGLGLEIMFFSQLTSPLRRGKLIWHSGNWPWFARSRFWLATARSERFWPLCSCDIRTKWRHWRAADAAADSLMRMEKNESYPPQSLQLEPGSTHHAPRHNLSRQSIRTESPSALLCPPADRRESMMSSNNLAAWNSN